MLRGYLLLLILILNLGQPSHAEKYKRAMVFAGGQLATAVHIGMLDAAVERGMPPDLIIGTCGGSMAAAMVAAYPDQQERLVYLFGSEFFQLYNGMVRFNSMTKALRVLWSMNHFDSYPNIFDHFVLHIPMLSGTSWDQTPINQPRQGPSILLVAGKVLKGREIIGVKDDQGDFFQEVHFTDAKTAHKIQGFASPMAVSQPDSARIVPEISVDTEMNLYPAVRASGADPFLTELPVYKGQRYITGAINIQPVELAASLADEVIMRYPLDMPDQEFNYLKGIFGFDPRQRAREVANKGLVNFWVDFTDWDDHYKNFGFFPHFSMKKMVTLKGTSDDGVPDNLIEFQKKIKAQYQYGYERMQEAFARTSTDPRNYIRRLTPGNDRHTLYQRDYQAILKRNKKIRRANRNQLSPEKHNPLRGQKESALPRWEDYQNR